MSSVPHQQNELIIISDYLALLLLLLLLVGRMMDNRSSCVPPGFRFHPTDVELVGYYLTKKVASQKIDLDVIPDIDLYRIEPWDLQDKCGMGYEVQKDEWYFFSYKDKKYPTGTRSNRATMAGFWKATGRDKAVHGRSNLIIGMRKTLVFYKGRAPSGQITDWIMHEYRLQSQHHNVHPQEEGWVVCRAFKKRFLTTNGQTKRSLESWDPTYYDDYQDLYVGRSEKPINPISINATEINSCNNDHEEDDPCIIMGSSSKKVTDWRDLDKFVAAQLSHGDSGSGLQCDKEEEGSTGLNDISTSGCDVGICIFNK